MADEQDRAPNSPEIVVRRLVKETGITEEQARELTSSSGSIGHRCSGKQRL